MHPVFPKRKGGSAELPAAGPKKSAVSKLRQSCPRIKPFPKDQLLHAKAVCHQVPRELQENHLHTSCQLLPCFPPPGSGSGRKDMWWGTSRRSFSSFSGGSLWESSAASSSCALAKSDRERFFSSGSTAGKQLAYAQRSSSGPGRGRKERRCL